MASATSGPIELLEANFISNCASASGAALIFYEHITTFNQEVKFFWGKKSFPAVLFFVNRLLALVYGAVYVSALTNIYSQTSCEVVQNVLDSFILAIGAVSEVVTLLRVYAVTERSWRVTIIIALLVVADWGLDIVEAFVNESTGVIVSGPTAICYTFSQNSFASTYTKVTITSLVISVVLNVVTVGVIWRTLHKQLSRNSTGVFSQRPSLVALLLRDGTIQFVTLLLLNISIDVLVVIGQNAAYVVNNLEIPLNAILVSRILLNIQETAQAAWREQSDTPSFVRSRHGVQTGAAIDIPSLVIHSDASTSIPAIDPEAEPSAATTCQANTAADESMVAGPSDQDRHHRAQQVEVPMEAGSSGEGCEHDPEQRQAEGAAAENWEEEDDWEDDH